VLIALDDQQSNAGVQVFSPTAVLLANADALYAWDRVILRWTTVNEAALLGFRILRRRDEADEWVPLTQSLLPAQRAGMAQGAAYEFVDENVEPGQTYFYRLEMVMAAGRADAVELIPSPSQQLFLPFISR
jgi:hypothetical protein